MHLRWDSKHVLVVGHVATRWALEHYLNHKALEELIEAEFHWQAGWEYFLP
jgi:2,3-bisphosphoglycerate-dependent phosphoglycerate mutase